MRRRIEASQAQGASRQRRKLLLPGAFALYEKHESKKDPEHAHRHKIEEEIAAAAAVGGGGYAFHEKHERKEAREEAEEAHGKKHHHLF
ncbi:uncharacterized protein A4U43_C02F7460 [Asparagus officinalis]|uniref:Uncharacterized protein n=1 Tax=Asparagus officinalis TaxID=4686 RepID=A0A5P1FII8_ASPOF|nr:uncharacterized protein A4U43_C02F7460 [Asparagus officinalis]